MFYIYIYLLNVAPVKALVRMHTPLFWLVLGQVSIFKTVYRYIFIFITKEKYFKILLEGETEKGAKSVQKPTNRDKYAGYA